MRRVVTAVLVLGGLVGVATPAWAKGPTVAVVEGAGFAARVESYERVSGMPGLGELLEHTGGAVMFGDAGHGGGGDGPGGAGAGGLLAERPAGELGERFTVTYLMERDVVLAQELYPFAAGGPWTFTPAGQRSIFTGGAVPHGWFRAPDALTGTVTALRTGTPAPAGDPASVPNGDAVAAEGDAANGDPANANANGATPNGAANATAPATTAAGPGRAAAVRGGAGLLAAAGAVVARRRMVGARR
ncbi:MAG TPA: hypothetical protein VGD67_08840 [Pseudonocardiaceae bacterium]